MDHITYEIPKIVPQETTYDSFDALCCEAIIYRVNTVLTFFHRHNTDVVRDLPPPFILSPQFAERFALVIRKLIYPILSNSRQLRLLSSTINYKSTNSESFWTYIDDISKAALKLVWSTTWENLKPVEIMKGEEIIHRVKESTKELRSLLQPASPNDYDIPHIGTLEI